MNVHNAADLEQYTQLMSRQRLTLQKAKARQGQRPRDRRSRQDAYSKFMLSLMLSGRQRDDRHLIHTSLIPPSYHPCIAPLAELRPAAIRDLQLEIHHRGTYLLLRSITPPQRMTAIMALMEDKKDDVVLLQLYQQEDEISLEATKIVNIGTILLVKEPYFKVMGDGEYGLRVDHVSDVVHLKEGNTMIPDEWRPRLIEIETTGTAESLKLRGNAAVGEHRYRDAITEYSNALKQPATANQIEVIKRNRSLAYLKMKQFDAALSDTGFPTFTSTPSDKALFRAAEALYYLGRYSECCEVLEVLHTNFPENKQASEVLARARSRFLEQKTGKYNFKYFQAKAKKLQPPHLDAASYIGPVEVKQTQSKGRGLFVTKAVKAGDLLLCEKAFSHAHVSDRAADNAGSSSEVTMLVNIETNQGFRGGQADLLKSIVQSLYRNPSLAPAFTALYHGPYEAVTTSAIDGEPVVDTFLVERIINFNVFGCPVSSVISHKNVRDGKEMKEKAHHSCGIWTQASYINHSCTSNARRAFIGDMMIVRATRDMESGTEITFWYHSPLGASAKAEQEKFKHWDFVCDCAICQDSRDTKAAVAAEREKVMKNLKRAYENPLGIQMRKANKLLEALNNTYIRPAHEVPRLLLWDPLLVLVRMYARQSDVVKCLDSASKVLTSLGFIVVGADTSTTSFAVVKWGLMIDQLVETFLHLKAAFVAIDAYDDAARADEYARTAYKTLVGEDTSFNTTYV
ncbi:MAG: hypothetical protein Q9157_003370 [Trypethelium eluteriae]